MNCKINLLKRINKKKEVVGFYACPEGTATAKGKH